MLYGDEATPVLDADEVARYLERTLGISAAAKPDFIRRFGGKRKGLAESMAEARVHDVSRPFSLEEPAYGEVAFERRSLEEPGKRSPGVLYDGLRLQKTFREMLPARERTLRVQHIVFTSRLIGTFESDGRYHAHVNLCGYPSIVSTSGVVEAPARPREYYLLKQRFIEAGEAVPFELLKERFSGQFIDYDDPRLTEVLKGYALQCAVYSITKESFCAKKTCRLFDAHWQAEMIAAQLGGERFCEKHSALLKAIKDAATS